MFKQMPGFSVEGMVIFYLSNISGQIFFAKCKESPVLDIMRSRKLAAHKEFIIEVERSQ